MNLPGVDGAAVSVETPDLFTDETVGVDGFCYDDEPGHVRLTFGTAFRVAVTLEASDARELAEQIDAAADEAEADL